MSEGDSTPSGTASSKQAPPPPEQQPPKRLSEHELFQRASHAPCQVVDVVVEPQQARRTSPEIIERELKRVYQANTLEEVVQALEVALAHLEQLDVFTTVEAELGDANPEDRSAARLRLLLPEARTFRGSAGTYVQGGEGSFELRVRGSNLLGVADQWELAGELGHRNSRNLLAACRLPRAGGSDFTPFLRLFQLTSNQQQLSSWTEALRGLRLGVTCSERLLSQVYWEAGWRQLLAGPGACRGVKGGAGDTLRSAAGLTWAMDGRQPGEFLSQGLLLGGLVEVAGLGPGAGPPLLKQRLDASWATNLSSSLAFTLNASAGLLLPLASLGSSPSLHAPATPLPDRFFLGGVEHGLRGFASRGVEPAGLRPQRTTAAGSSADSSSSTLPGRFTTPAAADGRVYDALGGDVFTSVMAALRLKLPGLPGDVTGMHLQLFVNGGSSLLMGGGSSGTSSSGGAAGSSPSGGVGGWRGSVTGAARELLNTFRWSAGTGVVLPTPFGSFELNYCWVLTHQERDRVKQGLQLGFAAGGAVGRHAMG